MHSKLGQTFLNNPYYLKAIADKADLTINDFVIEIGGGTGNLTEFLLKQAGQVISVELDRELAEVLRLRFVDNKKLIVIQKDILNIDLNDLLILKKTSGKTKIIGNIPYYITTPIIFKFLDYKARVTTAFDEMIILIQKEVAQRLIAEPGTKDYGFLTVSAQYKAKVKIFFTVPKTVFKPRPKVDSALVSLTPRVVSPVNVFNSEIFWKIVKSIFMFRRKTLKNSLICGGFLESVIIALSDLMSPENKCRLYSDEQDDNKFVPEFDLNIRGEKLDIKQMAELSNIVASITRMHK